MEVIKKPPLFSEGFEGLPRRDIQRAYALIVVSGQASVS